MKAFKYKIGDMVFYTFAQQLPTGKGKISIELAKPIDSRSNANDEKSKIEKLFATKDAEPEEKEKKELLKKSSIFEFIRVTAKKLGDK